MNPIVVLDAGPLNLTCYDPGRPVPDRCLKWLADLDSAGIIIILPSIADFEVRRELIRLGASSRLRNLDALRYRLAYLDISREALDKAAAFWADLRNKGLPTAGPDSLDADAILAGMAATIGRPGDSVIVATTNVRHLTRFPGMDARFWEAIG